ncbi:alpha/beta hydrolase fold protein [Chondrocystis sp. NIES-4102]|nr:alpha/beta hydrolase fold protein [Chondrocystis sp. NIES-4102]
MLRKKVLTNLGEIALEIEQQDTDPPIVFMHGLYLDKSLWADYGSNITGKTHIYLDMPSHGDSSNIDQDWNLDDCVTMLLQILDNLGIQKCIAIAHSWGSMTAVRTAYKFPERFAALGLFNMPFKRTAGLDRLGFTMQKFILMFPEFYGQQAAKSLYSEEILSKRPELAVAMGKRLSKRPAKEIERLIDAVILNTTDITQILNQLQVPALAVVGESDYVGTIPHIPTKIVKGGHITPHESIEETKQAIKQVIELAESSN